MGRVECAKRLLGGGAKKDLKDKVLEKKDLKSGRTALHLQGRGGGARWTALPTGIYLCDWPHCRTQPSIASKRMPAFSAAPPLHASKARNSSRQTCWAMQAVRPMWAAEHSRSSLHAESAAICSAHRSRTLSATALRGAGGGAGARAEAGVNRKKLAVIP